VSVQNEDHKKLLTTREAVEEGFFSSMQTAANLRHKKTGPRYYRPTSRRILYRRSDLEDWVNRGMILTEDYIPRANKL